MTISISLCDVAPAPQPMPALDRSRAILGLLGAGPRVADEPVETITIDGLELRLGPPRAPRSDAPRRKVEQYWESDACLVTANDINALAQAAHDAFYLHHPLVLSPDAVWFTLAQGLATHVSLHAEELRPRFVKHAGKKELVVIIPDFFLGQHNPWPIAFAAFSDQIAEHVGKLRDLVVCDFSTTGPIERAASEVLVMDTFQTYFEYVAVAGCGIPSIELCGTPEDWRSVRTRAAMLSELGLEAWTDALLPVLDEIVRTAEGHVSADFWRSYFRYQSGSGPAELTGWILTFFPYLKLWSTGREELAPNPYLAKWKEGHRIAETRKGWWIEDPQGPAIASIPPSLASAPVKLIDVRDRSEHRLRFVAGMFGVTQSASHALAPEFGWAVVHEPGD